MPTLKGTEVSLSYEQCFLYLVSSSRNVSIFHNTWLDTLSPHTHRSIDLSSIYLEDKLTKCKQLMKLGGRYISIHSTVLSIFL